METTIGNTPRRGEYDAVVVGSGPNGFAAAITLARAGLGVLMVEARGTPGGGMRSAELTLPGMVHDVCSAVHPLAASSPFFSRLPLEEFGLSWVHPPTPLAHPLDGGSAAVLERGIPETASTLGKDGKAYTRLISPLATNAENLFEDLLGPLRIPKHPFGMARFGLKGVRSAAGLAKSAFKGEAARALFAGNAAHSVLPLEKPLTAAIGLVLAASGHAIGWPVARGGSGRIADALAGYFLSFGGEIVCGREVKSIDHLPLAGTLMFDLSPPALARIAGDRLPAGYRRKLEGYRFGPGACKVDLALSDPIPWKAEACRRAGTVHVGGRLEEIAASERDCWEGRHSEKPFVLVAQPSLFDDTRTPTGRHTCWAYCHVPHGSGRDMRDPIVNQIERFAPGFRDCILGEHVMTAPALAGYNANYVGGDITGGVQDFRQTFTRPVARWDPYSTPARGVFLCSASTPPGGGVHGMCGYWAARSALRRLGLEMVFP